MLTHKRPLKVTLALALAGAAVAPAAASARPLPPDPPQPAHQRPIQFVQVTPDRGFDWGDAAIGAAGGLGLSMLTAGGVLVVQRRGRSMSATG